jgi:hypothetical protein
MTHTPGPWRVGDAGVTVFGPNLGKPSPETIANVRKRDNAALIALAPDMLALLTECHNRLDAVMGNGIYELRVKIADLLTRAKG